MAPGSRVVQAVFSRFSDEDSSQMGDAIGKPRVESRSWSCGLSQGSKLADQIATSWKESVHEGGYSGGKTRRVFSTFSLFSLVFARTVDMAPDIDFQ